MNDQTVVVEIPGVGNVEFPATMSTTDIARASARMRSEALRQSAGDKPRGGKRYTVKDPTSGKTVVLTGDSPPTKEELEHIFSEINKSGSTSRSVPSRYKPPPGIMVVDESELFDAPPPQPAQARTTELPDARDWLKRGLSGFASMVLPSTEPRDYIEGPIRALTNPVDSFSLLVDAIRDGSLQQIEKARAATEASFSASDPRTRRIETVKALAHGFGAVPVIGPAAVATGEAFADGNIAEGVGMTAGLLSPIGARRLPVPSPRSIPGVTGALSRARTGSADAMKRGIERRMVDVTAPKTGSNKIRFGNMAEEVAPRLVREPGLGAYSREGLQGKVEGRLGEATAKLDDVANARLSARTFDVQPVIAELLARRKRLTAESVEASRPTRTVTERTSPILDERGRPVKVMDARAEPAGRDVVPRPNATRVAAIDRAIGELQKLGPSARYESLRRIREAYDGPAQTVYSPSMTADFLKAQGAKLGAADVTGVLREYLAKADPQTAAANAEYSLFRKASDVLRAAEETERVRPNMFRKTMGRVTGAATGGAAGGGAGAVAGVITADFLDMVARSGITTKVATARMMARLEDALRGHRSAEVQAILKRLETIGVAARRTSVLTGRTQAATAR